MKKLNKKSLVLLVCVALLLTCAVGSTVAYLVDKTQSLTNTFTPAKVDIEIEETFANNVKNDVKIKNVENIDAYIRAAVIVTWQNTAGEVYGVAPKEGTDYTITWTKDGWEAGTDGFYYYTSPVAPGASTGVLFTDCTPVEGKAPEGYTLHVEILAQGIQAEGMGATSAQDAFAKAKAQ